MENKSISKKFGIKKTRSLLKVFSKEWVVIFSIFSIVIMFSGLILIILQPILIIKRTDYILSNSYRYLFETGLVLSLFGAVCLTFATNRYFGVFGIYYTIKKNKYSKSKKVLSVYNEIGEKYNTVFKKLEFNKIYILPSCSNKQDISSPKNRNLDNKYFFIKNDKEYVLVFNKMSYATEFEEHEFFRKILFRADLYEIVNNQKIQLNLKDRIKDSDLIASDAIYGGNFELLGIKGVSLSKTSYHYLFNAIWFSFTAVKEKEKGVYSSTGMSWEGYTYWNKNMKEWRKDYLQESYRLPGVWCNNDVKAKDMDEYIEKKINFECQLINDIFDNFETDQFNMDNKENYVK